MGEHVIHTLLDTGIHQFVWSDNSRDAVYEHAAYYQDIIPTLAADDVFRVLIDLRESGAPPFRILNDIFQKSGLRRDVQYRTAYMADDVAVQILMKNFAVANRISGNRAFFFANEEQQAIDWLLQAE